MNNSSLEIRKLDDQIKMKEKKMHSKQVETDALMKTVEQQQNAINEIMHNFHKDVK